MVLYFPRPASATGEDVAEFHVHGGRAVLASLFASLSAMENLRAADPGVRNVNLYPGYTTQGAPTSNAAAGGPPAYPGAIPVRRLFQLPDAYAESNASEPMGSQLARN